jgi:hypothetical protein
MPCIESDLILEATAPGYEMRSACGEPAREAPREAAREIREDRLRKALAIEEARQPVFHGAALRNTSQPLLRQPLFQVNP